MALQIPASNPVGKALYMSDLKSPDGKYINALGKTFDNFGSVFTPYGSKTVFTNNGTINNNSHFTHDFLATFFNTSTDPINNATINNNAGSTFNVGGVSTFTNGGDGDGVNGTFNNLGTVTVDSGGAKFINSGTFSTFNNQGGSILQIEKNSYFINETGTFLTNQGHIIIDIEDGVPDSAGELHSQAEIQNNGRITNNGIVNLTGGGSITRTNGIIDGTGKWIGGIDLSGTLAPGNSSGGMLFTGDVTYGETSTKEIELGGSDSFEFHRNDTQHDFTEIQGDLLINGGQLNVSLIDGFELDLNHEFIIAKVDGELAGTFEGLEEGAIVGSFDSVYGQIPMNLFITYEGGDGNDIALYTADNIFGISNI